MRITTRAITALFLALPFAFAGSAGAQEAEAQPEEVQVCTATLTPAAVTIGEAPVRISAALSQEIGYIDFEAPEESGLTVVAPEDVPMEEMAAEEGTEEEAAPLADEANTFVIWLDTQNAQAGSFDVVLTGENGTCTATLEIEGTEGN